MFHFKAVVFDIDGTLTHTNSWNLLTEKLGADPNEHHRIYLARRSGALTLDEARNLLINLWVKTGNANEDFIRNIFKKTKLREGARELFSYLHKKDYLTCLITGSNNIYASEIAAKLNTKYYYSNCIFHFNDKGILKYYEYSIEQGAKKLEQLNDFCQKNNLKLKECTVVGDSANDLEMFVSTGNGVAVKTEDEEVEIEKAAWKKIDNLLELKKILL